MIDLSLNDHFVERCNTHKTAHPRIDIVTCRLARRIPLYVTADVVHIRLFKAVNEAGSKALSVSEGAAENDRQQL